MFQPLVVGLCRRGKAAWAALQSGRLRLLCKPQVGGIVADMGCQRQRVFDRSGATSRSRTNPG
jgi:hypothetical protein